VPKPEPTVTVPERSTDVRWGLGDAALGWVLAQIGGAIAAAIVLALNDDATDFEDLSLAWVAVAQLGLWFGMLGVPLLASKLKGHGPVRDYGLRSEGWDAPLGFAAGIVTQLLLIPLLYGPIFWLTDLDSNDLEDPARGLTDRATGSLGVAMLILIVGIGAPVVAWHSGFGAALRGVPLPTAAASGAGVVRSRARAARPADGPSGGADRCSHRVQHDHRAVPGRELTCASTPMPRASSSRP
jgi:hypothetical protein